ncbi:MAG: pseudouridylate synthase [Cyclobacteriaceae bacterium]
MNSTIPFIDPKLFFPLSKKSAQQNVDGIQLHIAEGGRIHAMSQIAVKQLQHYLSECQLDHDFGILKDQTGFGKMFGVLVVQKDNGELGYLRAFSGKWQNSNHHEGFVPPIFDSLEPKGFLVRGMKELTILNKNIAIMSDGFAKEKLKEQRKIHSQKLQNRVADQYYFLNANKEKRTMLSIFEEYSQGKPPGGAGECAAPKLLQFAFEWKLKPIALAEFYWGRHSGSDKWKHEQLYAPCKEKCVPILKHMLS